MPSTRYEQNGGVQGLAHPPPPPPPPLCLCQRCYEIRFHALRRIVGLLNRARLTKQPSTLLRRWRQRHYVLAPHGACCELAVIKKIFLISRCDKRVRDICIGPQMRGGGNLLERTLPFLLVESDVIYTVLLLYKYTARVEYP